MPALIYGKVTGRRIDGKNIRYLHQRYGLACYSQWLTY